MARVIASVIVRDVGSRHVTYYRATMLDRWRPTAGAGSARETTYQFRDERDTRWRDTGWSSVPKPVYRRLRTALKAASGGER